MKRNTLLVKTNDSSTFLILTILFATAALFTFCHNLWYDQLLFPIFNENIAKLQSSVEKITIVSNHLVDELDTYKHHAFVSANKLETCDAIAPERRVDCMPGAGIATAKDCLARSCCWRTYGNTPIKAYDEIRQNRRIINQPFCFFPLNYPSYTVTKRHVQNNVLSVDIERSQKSPWPYDVTKLRVDLYYTSHKQFRIKIYDPAKHRYEVPLPLHTEPPQRLDQEYEVALNDKPFRIAVTRRSTGAVLFAMVAEAPLIFAHQFLQLTTELSSNYVFGLGEHKAPLQKGGQWKQYSYWNRDARPEVNTNLYGTHPFFINLEANGQAHGVFLLNSNGMDVDISPAPAATFRSIGGILDFFVFTGPSPDDVISQYTRLVGTSYLPPYWSLGFHLCRYGIHNSTTMRELIHRNRAINIPYDVQWHDIDYMREKLDWTYDEKINKGLTDIVDNLHQNNQRYVMIVDPGISSSQKPGTYPPFDDGLQKGVFVLNATGQPLVGRVWPGLTVFPDFTNRETENWWFQQAYAYHKQVSFDGMWIDMNEPSSFMAGSTSGCTSGLLDNPPYIPGVDKKLYALTICPSAKQSISTHYNLHNMYGYFESVATKRVLEKLRNSRAFVLSRSSFSSSGAHTGVWTGDITSSWEDLYFSIPNILDLNMAGVSLAGADICGFGGNTTEELCTRWMQLGAWYPFMRNHNAIGQRDQDPAVWSSSAQDAMRDALNRRYYLLPYLYTLFHRANTDGTPVMRPLVFQYPSDSATYSLDRQFLWGDAILVTPVLNKGATLVQAYFPNDVWYDYYSGATVDDRGKIVVLDAPLDKINVHLRGGRVVPVQKPRHNAFGLLISLSADGSANGELVWDDGSSLNTVQRGAYNRISFTVSKRSLTSTVTSRGYVTDMVMDHFYLYGIDSETVTSVRVNDQNVKFDIEKNLLKVHDFKADLLKVLLISW